MRQLNIKIQIVDEQQPLQWIDDPTIDIFTYENYSVIEYIYIA